MYTFLLRFLEMYNIMVHGPLVAMSWEEFGISIENGGKMHHRDFPSNTTPQAVHLCASAVKYILVEVARWYREGIPLQGLT
jgi:hypothetical protein